MTVIEDQTSYNGFWLRGILHPINGVYHTINNEITNVWVPYKITRKCMTLWGEPERIHEQNIEQLHAYDCHQNVTEPRATENHTHVYTGTVSQAWL